MMPEGNNQQWTVYLNRISFSLDSCFILTLLLHSSTMSLKCVFQAYLPFIIMLVKEKCSATTHYTIARNRSLQSVANYSILFLGSYLKASYFSPESHIFWPLFLCCPRNGGGRYWGHLRQQSKEDSGFGVLYLSLYIYSL